MCECKLNRLKEIRASGWEEGRAGIGAPRKAPSKEVGPKGSSAAPPGDTPGVPGRRRHRLESERLQIQLAYHDMTPLRLRGHVGVAQQFLHRADGLQRAERLEFEGRLCRKRRLRCLLS